MHRLLVHDDASDELGVVHGAPVLLGDLDVVHVDLPLAVHLLRHVDHGVDCHLGHQLLGAGDRLAHHGGLRDLHKGIAVLGLDLDRHGIDDLHGLVAGHAVPGGDDGRVDVGIDEVDGLLQQLAGEDHRGGGPIPALLVLGLGDLHEHLGGGVLDVDLLQDGDAVVGDDDVAHGVDEHLVHSAGP